MGDLGLGDERRLALGVPFVIGMTATVGQPDEHLTAVGGGVETAWVGRLLAGLEELVPEERLQGVEVDAAALHEVHLVVGCLDVLLVYAVHDEHIVGCELQASHLHQS